MENKKTLEERFKDKLKENGQTLKWFYLNRIKGNIKITYAGFAGQLNDYSPLSDEAKKELRIYLGE
jgi:hypothetical protein